MELHWPLILFTFFVCLASGILFAQGLLTTLGKGKKMQVVSLAASLATLVIGGIAVFLHLQHWERIFNGFGHITSGITLEFIGCVVFFIALVVFFLMMRRSETGEAPKWCGIMAMIVGVAMVVVMGDSYLMSALPAWNTPLLIVFYVCNMVFMSGFAGIIIAAFVGEEDAKELMVKIALIGSVLEVIAVLVYGFVVTSQAGAYTDLGMYFDPTLPDVAMVNVAAIINVMSGNMALPFWLGSIVVGGIAPIALAFLATKANDVKGALPYAISGIVCATIGGICWRCILYVVAISVFAVF